MREGLNHLPGPQEPVGRADASEPRRVQRAAAGHSPSGRDAEAHTLMEQSLPPTVPGPFHRCISWRSCCSQSVSIWRRRSAWENVCICVKRSRVGLGVVRTLDVPPRWRARASPCRLIWCSVCSFEYCAAKEMGATLSQGAPSEAIPWQDC